MFRSVRPWALALFALALVPSTAAAWTDATVRTARARVSLSEDASTLHVVLTAELRVDRGWLEGFELDGLDDGLVLDEAHPVRFERWAEPELPEPVASEAGGGEAAAIDVSDAAEPVRPRPVFVELLAPRVSVDGGRVALSFSRRHAPRAGLYRVIVTYDAPAASRILRSPEHAELAWTLPAWRFGLDNVEVVLGLPEGSAPTPLPTEDEVAIAVEPAELEAGEAGVAYRFTRVHLPRTQSWTIRAELPAVFRAPAASPEPMAPLPALEVDAGSHPAALVLATLLLAALVVGKARSRHEEATTAGASSGALVPLGPRVVLVLSLTLFWFGAGLVFLRPSLLPLVHAAIALSGAHRSSRPGGLRLGSFRSAWGGHVRAARAAARARRRADLFDAGTLPGGALLCASALVLALVAAGGWLLWADAVLLSAATFLVLWSGGGAARARSARVVLAELLGWCERRTSWPEGVAVAPLVHVDIQGRPQAARLRLVIDGAPDGLVRSDVVWGRRGPRLVVAGRAGSPAERTLLELAAEHRWPLADSFEGRIALTLGLELLSPLVTQLRAAPAPTALAAAS